MGNIDGKSDKDLYLDELEARAAAKAGVALSKEQTDYLNALVTLADSVRYDHWNLRTERFDQLVLQRLYEIDLPNFRKELEPLLDEANSTASYIWHYTSSKIFYWDDGSGFMIDSLYRAIAVMDGDSIDPSIYEEADIDWQRRINQPLTNEIIEKEAETEGQKNEVRISETLDDRSLFQRFVDFLLGR